MYVIYLRANSTSKDSSKGKSPTTSSKSGKSAKEQVEEPIFVQYFNYAKHDDAEFNNTNMPMDQGEDLGKTDEQPNDKAIPKNDWYNKSRSDTSPYPEWNEGKLIDDGPEQSWLNDLAKATKPPLTFDQLMHTPIDFSAFVMNRLKIDNLTKELLVGPVYNLLKGTCKSYVELDYTMKECYRALSEQLDWNNPEGHRCPYDLTKPLPVQMSSQGRQIVLVDFFFNNDLEYLRGGSNDKKYTASTTKSKATRYELKGIEYMVPNLWSPVKIVYDRYTLLGISHWGTKRRNFYGYITKMVFKHDVYSTKRILSIISVKVNEGYEYGYLEEIVVKRAYQKLYTFKEDDFKRLHLNDIEDIYFSLFKTNSQPRYRCHGSFGIELAYGYCKNLKKTVKTGQTRARERKSTQRAGRMLSKGRVPSWQSYTSPSPLIGGNPQGNHTWSDKKAQGEIDFTLETLTEETQMSHHGLPRLKGACAEAKDLEASLDSYIKAYSLTLGASSFSRF
ncbi:hypothetical protein Tco_1156454 [Tanacetum coccineum]